MNTASLASILSSQEVLKSKKQRLNPLPRSSDLAEQFFSANPDCNYLRYKFNQALVKKCEINGQVFLLVPVLHIFSKPATKFADGVGVLLANGEVYLEEKASAERSVKDLVLLTTEELFSTGLVGRRWSDEVAVFIAEDAVNWVCTNLNKLNHLHFIEVNSWSQALSSISKQAFKQPTPVMADWIYTAFEELLPKITVLSEPCDYVLDTLPADTWLAMNPVQYKELDDNKGKDVETTELSAKYLFDVLGRKLTLKQWNLPPPTQTRIKDYAAKARGRIKNGALQAHNLAYPGFTEVVDAIVIRSDKSLVFDENGCSCCVASKDIPPELSDIVVATRGFDFPCSDVYHTSNVFSKDQLDELLNLTKLQDPLGLGLKIIRTAASLANYEKNVESLKQSFAALLYERLELFFEPKPSDLVFLHNELGPMPYTFGQILTSSVTRENCYYPGYSYSVRFSENLFTGFDHMSTLDLIKDLSKHPLLKLSQHELPAEYSHNKFETVAALLNPAKQ